MSCAMCAGQAKSAQDAVLERWAMLTSSWLYSFSNR
jgi:hypothetical protein